MVFGRNRRGRRRRIRDGDAYTIDEDLAGQIEREEVPARPEPPVAVQGEMFGWTKGPPYPEGWRADEDYGPAYRDHDDPGPLDGRWPEAVG